MLFKYLFLMLSLAYSTSCFSYAYSTNYRLDNDSIIDAIRSNDPLNLEMHTLDNGLKVYLAPDHNTPRIRTSIMIKAGSKDDPASATGLAHYLEHLLFKGTDRLGVIDSQKEQVLLEQIEDLFEQYRFTSDTLERKKIYSKIDQLSVEASQYGMSKEYDDLMSEMGAWGVNAFTTFDRVGYISNIPANHLEKWLKLEVERFRNPVFRTFHTELETVYEEMNMIIDDGPRHSLFQLYEVLFPTHQYGSQTPIGKIEHLKSPSITEIKKYFDTYYVPNNMAIILVGDFDPKQALKLIKATFGTYQSKPVPKTGFPEEAPITSVLRRDIVSPGPDLLTIGFRFKGKAAYDTREFLLVTLVDMMLVNGRAGLIDLNINKAQKAQNVGSFVLGFKDYTMHVFRGTPKEGQSMDEVKDLILEEIENVKKGNFPDWLMEASINYLDEISMQTMESIDGKSGQLIESYTFEVPWEVQSREIERLRSITKEELVQFARKHYHRNNYAAIYKKKGLADEIKKIKKPNITPITIVKNQKSAFRQDLEKIKSPEVSTQFVDFSKEIETLTLKNGNPLYVHQNKTNDLFTLKVSFKIGQGSDKLLSLAAELLPFLGNSQYASAEVASEFYKLGCRFNVVTDDLQTSIYLSGIGRNFEKAATLLADVLKDLQADEEAMASFRETVLKNRADAKEAKYHINNHAIKYLLYGDQSPGKNVVSAEELERITSAELVAKLRQFLKLEHSSFFYGPQSPREAKRILERTLDNQAATIPVKRNTDYTYKSPKNDQIFLVNTESKQVSLIFASKLKSYSPYETGRILLFNEYLNDLVFKELREARGLAYSAYGRIRFPDFHDGHHYLFLEVGTQSDKYLEAIEVASQILRDMPIKEAEWASAKKSVLEQLRTLRSTKFRLLTKYELALNRNIDFDVYEPAFEALSNMSIDDFKQFYEDWIKNNALNVMVVGDLSEVNQQRLRKFGQVSTLSKQDLFGF